MSELSEVNDMIAPEAVEFTPSGQLPFAFSKKHELVMSHEGKASQLCFKQTPSVELLVEARRVIGHSFTTQKVDSDTFDKLVSRD